MIPGKHKFVLIFFTIIFRAALDALYYFWVSRYYAYSGLEFRPASLPIILLSYLLVITAMVFIPAASTMPSVFIVSFLLFLSYIPVTSLMAFGGFPVLPVIWFTLVFVFLFYFSSKESNLVLDFSFDKTGNLLFALILAIYAIGMILIISHFGIKAPPSILQVYDVRAEYKEAAEGASAIYGYTLLWMGNVIIPFLVAWCLVRRRIALLLVMMLSQLLVFSASGFKSQLFSVPFVIWIIIGVKYFGKKIILYTAASFVGMVSLWAAVDYAIGAPLMSGFVGHRLFFLPAQLYYHYIDFFSHNPQTHLSQIMPLKYFLEYPYNTSISQLIGDYYFPLQNMYANTGVWANGYANFGVAGIILFTILFKVFMFIVDSAAAKKNAYLGYSLICTILWASSNSAFFTMLLSHGGILAVVIMALLPRTDRVAAEKGK